MPPQVFVSYARENRKSAEELDALEIAHALGFPSCALFVCHIHAEAKCARFEQLNRKAQQTFLADEIRRSDGVVILWDRNYARSAWCGWELGEITKCDATFDQREAHGYDVVRPAPRWVKSLDRTPVPHFLRGDGRDRRRRSESLVVNPGFSLLESPFAPQLEGPSLATLVMGLLLRLLPVIAMVVIELLLWRVVRDQHQGAYARHLWSLVAALAVSLTLCSGLLVSVWAAVAGGAATMLVGIALALQVDSATEVTTRAAALAAFSGAVTFWSRQFFQSGREIHGLHDDRFDGWWSPGCLAGVVVAGSLLVCALLAVAVGRGDVAVGTTTEARNAMALVNALRSLPVLGAFLGAMFGVALGVGVARRVSSRRRDAEKRLSIPVLVGGMAALSCVAVGLLGGLWILENVRHAVSRSDASAGVGDTAGAYAGGLLGLVVCSAMSLPIVLSDSRASPRTERRWAIASLVVCAAVFAFMIDALEFGRSAPGHREAIMVGASGGLAAAWMLSWLWMHVPRAAVAMVASLALHTFVANFVVSCARRADNDSPPNADATQPPQIPANLVEVAPPPEGDGKTTSAPPKNAWAGDAGPSHHLPMPDAEAQAANYRREVSRELRREVARVRRRAIANEQREVADFEAQHGLAPGLVGGTGDTCTRGRLGCVDICTAGVIGSASAADVTIVVPPYHAVQISIESGGVNSYSLTITCDGYTVPGGQISLVGEGQRPPSVRIEATPSGRVCRIARSPTGYDKKFECPSWSVEDSGGAEADWDEPIVRISMTANLPAETLTDHELCQGKCGQAARQRVQQRRIDEGLQTLESLP